MCVCLHIRACQDFGWEEQGNQAVEQTDEDCEWQELHCWRAGGGQDKVSPEETTLFHSMSNPILLNMANFSLACKSLRKHICECNTSHFKGGGRGPTVEWDDAKTGWELVPLVLCCFKLRVDLTFLTIPLNFLFFFLTQVFRSLKTNASRPSRGYLDGEVKKRQWNSELRAAGVTWSRSSVEVQFVSRWH